jgi:hypothetical protein
MLNLSPSVKRAIWAGVVLLIAVIFGKLGMYFEFMMALAYGHYLGMTAFHIRQNNDILKEMRELKKAIPNNSEETV